MSIDGRVIRGVDCTADTFRRSFRRLPNNVQAEARQVIAKLLFAQLDALPRAWHMHALTHKKVDAVCSPGQKVTPWTLHITADDRYKASFTLEDAVAYFRLCDEHDIVDKNP